MAEDRSDPLADMFTLFAAPLSGAVRSIDQFRKGVDEFLRGVENFNRTMENLNETSERINTLLVEVEEPLRAAIPQVTRTVRTADQMMQVVSGPAMAAAPGLDRLAKTLSTPAFAQLPDQMAQFSDILAEVSRRMGPLAAMAESAGGLFGGFRVPGTRPANPSPATPPPSTAATADDTTSDPSSQASAATTRKRPVKKATTAKKKTSTPKRSAPRKKPGAS